MWGKCSVLAFHLHCLFGMCHAESSRLPKSSQNIWFYTGTLISSLFDAVERAEESSQLAVMNARDLDHLMASPIVVVMDLRVL
jgi:hypothetical protein